MYATQEMSFDGKPHLDLLLEAENLLLNIYLSEWNEKIHMADYRYCENNLKKDNYEQKHIDFLSEEGFINCDDNRKYYTTTKNGRNIAEDILLKYIDSISITSEYGSNTDKLKQAFITIADDENKVHEIREIESTKNKKSAQFAIENPCDLTELIIAKAYASIGRYGNTNTENIDFLKTRLCISSVY